MVKKQFKCQHCGKEYFATLVNVYVIKQRICPNSKCKNPLTIYSDKLVCGKCDTIVNREDSIIVNGLGVKIIDATMDYHKRDAYAAKGMEIKKKVEPEKQLCTRCINTRRHIENILVDEIVVKKEAMDELKALSDIDFYDKFYNQFQPMLQKMMFQKAVDSGKIKLQPSKGIPVRVKPLVNTNKVSSGDNKTVETKVP